MFKLWALPKAAPVLLRHVAAYIELVSVDLARSSRELSARIVASVIVAICGLFSMMLVCLLVVAFTWDTPYRIHAVACMLAVFVIATIIALNKSKSSASTHAAFLADAKKQWLEDKALWERLFPHPEHPEDKPHD